MRVVFSFFISMVLFSCITVSTFAQTPTTAFKYQGSLTDAGAPANGSFQMQFRLFDAASAGTQIGPTLTDLPVTVTNGIFGVTLDFGSNPLTGANRWLEISIRRNSGETYTTLGPREQLTSSPYAVRTISAATADDAQRLGGLPANQFVRISDNGTANRVPLWTSGTTLANSFIYQSGSNIGINASNPQSRFHTVGTSWFQGDSTPLPTAAGKGIAMGFAGEQGYVFGFDYGAFGPKNLILNGPGGSVGIGTVTPTHTLDVNGFLRAYNPAGGNVVSETTGGTNSWAKLWAKTPSQQWSIGSSNNFADNQLYFSNENPGGGIRMAIKPNGNMTQHASGYGLPKAMLYVLGAGTPYGIAQCYNGVTGQSTDGCGFLVIREDTGRYAVDLNFYARDRFLAATPYSQGGTLLNAWAGPYLSAGVEDTVAVRLFLPNGTPVNAEFFLIVY